PGALRAGGDARRNRSATADTRGRRAGARGARGTVNLALAYVKARTLELARLPAFTIPTVVFPAVLYLAVAGRRHGDAAVVTAGFAAIAVLGVAFFQFGVGIASERISPWERYLRSLPAGPVPRIGGRV